MTPQSLYPWLAPSDVRPVPKMREIAQAVAERHGIDLATLRGPQRRRAVAWPRHEAWAITIATGSYSYPQVARFYGNRNHTTVIHGVRAHEARRRGVKLVKHRLPEAADA